MVLDGLNSFWLKKMHHFGVVQIDQGIHLFHPDTLAMIQKFFDEQFADALFLVIGINADGIQFGFLLEKCRILP